MVKLVPEPTGLPPLEAVYQVIVPGDAVVNTSDPDPQVVSPVKTGAEGTGIIAASTEIRLLLHVFPVST